jgi:hypothetical protein
MLVGHTAALVQMVVVGQSMSEVGVEAQRPFLEPEMAENWMAEHDDSSMPLG